ncbi:nucleoside-diphosphate sugar epimerase/dehydratase [Devosia sp. MC521]|uniref:nucleoside-diphosphate sugar epimerase/dehydratase n=1 Tax=Devosia sp. MC521 TaxID=2759954 RepID=UPI0015FD55FC|nr:nucleoside-diphosphate sugar epimerase/dehydratase [Devosia sp. MC521]MBJ6989008.1 polysaccharide biosynthesis protein [Devosia sp. MC521]QMW62966.1 polysaccharide biosynthesis protein [Devosia sp. MC521]
MIKKVRSNLIELPRGWKRAILIFADFAVLALCLWASFSLRLDRWALPHNLEALMIILAGPVVAIPVFVRMGLYRAVVRYLPERALWTMLGAVTFAVLLWVVAAFLLQFISRNVTPRSVPIIYWALACVCIVGSRFAAKRILGVPVNSTLPAVVVYGAGEAGMQLATSLRGTHLIAGFLDDNPGLHRREVAGLRVHPPGHLPALVRDYGVKQVILCMPAINSSRRKEIVAAISNMSVGVSVQSLPAMTDLVTGNYLVSQVRQIEIDDLLGRSPVPPDLELIRSMIVGRTIMVTGAGGSIGSELCRKIAQWHPQRLVLFEANEFALYSVERELRGGDLSIVPILASVTDEASVAHAIVEHSVDVVFHAAAYKHVPLVEANALEGIKNNIFGTKIVADTAFRLGVQNFVLISSDKAVRPTNVMGATKRWAELIVQHNANKAAEAQTDQRFCSVRFGNVLGSNGSVVPLFKEQIAMGGPVTLTDRAMTRYFMSIKEAAELIVQAGSLSEGGDVFLLDMGEPVLVADLAENMVRLAGLQVRTTNNPDGDIDIVVIGKRPGEKMYEELFYDDTTAMGTSHPKIMRSTNSTVATLDDALIQMRDALDRTDESAARHILFDMVAKSDRYQQT